MGHVASAPRCGDAVLIVPGIMGSELVEVDSGRQLWGLRDPHWYVRAWRSSDGLSPLHLDDRERAGRCERVRATRLLRFSAFAPMLRGIEPYTRLVRAVERTVLHPTAVAEFPYDWRLPVVENARRLADVALAHLRQWTATARSVADTSRRSEPPALVLIAHSMGGLLARAALENPALASAVRRVVTLGTPFYGSVKAGLLICTGQGTPLPLPARRVRELASGLPGVYDLLPVNRCVDADTHVRPLQVADVVALGGDPQLAAESFGRRGRPGTPFPVPHVQVVGAHQPTWQSIRIRDGVAQGERYTCQRDPDGGVRRVDLAGDGTVSRESAQLDGAATPLAQSHGAIARTPEALLVVTDTLTGQDRGPWLGTGDYGLECPDVVSPGQPFEIRLDRVDHPRDAEVTITDTATGRVVQRVLLRCDGGRIIGETALADASMYRVSVTGGGGSPVSELLLCA